ncbi:hypothetical protein F5Y08DRAFT_346881 [Xylaria arbuscula]|nr:hypothetical protein F5Y08DRAFT_346881 [Xylaria arbuscula]
MTKSRRKNILLQSKSSLRGLKAASPVLSMFKARYVRNTNQVQFTQKDIGQIKDPKKLKAKKKLQQEKNRGRAAAAKRGDIPLEQLIQPLVFVLQAETLEYLYPYLHMHRWC